jgi:catechol 2,3-dioxygenase-like lactoylglutathione lyase family enzyme
VHARIHHVQIAVPPGSEARARSFYVGVLGLAEVPKPPALAARGGLWLSLGDSELHLGVEKAFRPALKAHPAFEVLDLDGLRRRLEAAGVRTEEDGELPGRQRFYAHDPFGNRLEFVAAGGD